MKALLTTLANSFNPLTAKLKSKMTLETMENPQFRVVVNHEAQYSIWPAKKSNAPGWDDAGFEGTKSECLFHIRRIWTDMRPLSLRQSMQGGRFFGNAAQSGKTIRLAA